MDYTCDSVNTIEKDSDAETKEYEGKNDDCDILDEKLCGKEDRETDIQITEHESVIRTESGVSTTSIETTSSFCNSMNGTILQRNKTVRCMPEKAEIENIQKKFCERFIQTFLRKKKKYENILHENSMSTDNDGDHADTGYDKTFEEEVEIIVSEESEKTAKCITSPWRRKSLGRRYSLRNLVRHVYVVVRRTKARRIISKLVDISDQDLHEVLQTISLELSISYQYQISILSDDNELYKAADYAVSCILAELKSKDSVFNATEALEAVTEVAPKQYFPSDEYLKTRIIKRDSVKGKRRQRWVVAELFKEPGIRFPEQDGFKYYSCFTPYGHACRPEKYGFRGPLHVWNEKEGKYTMIPNDVISCYSSRRHEVEFDSENIHHNFVPVSLCQHEN